MQRGHLQMLNKVKNRKQEGFTIIEVLIVLAIAGLILLIVFLAVPALQRNSRNTQRKSDASRVASAITNFASNTNGTLPTSANWATQCATILNDAGSFGQGAWTSANCVTAQGANSIVLATGSVTPTAQTTGFEAIVVTGAQCSTTNPGSTAAGSARQSAVLYDLETASGNYNWACVNAT
jgi:prepilin-type N-terminal cleavage/methylation domain-containing protein